MNDAARQWDGPGLDAWQPWHPDEVATVLAGMPAPWCVVGGWAIDLWLGERTRAHADIEIAIPRAYFPVIRRHLAAFELFSVGDGEVRALPKHATVDADKRQNWVLEPGLRVWRMDIMLEPGDADTWIFRRDERVRAPRANMVASRNGVPHLTAQGALLFKAKALGEKDAADFNACVPWLDAPSRAWLAHALQIAHPGHPWIARL